MRKGDYSDILGVWQLQISSPLLTQGSLFRLIFSLEGLPSEVQILDLKCRFDQTFTIKSIDSPERHFEPEPQRIPLFTANSCSVKSEQFTIRPAASVQPQKRFPTAPLADLKASEPWEFVFEGRIPLDTGAFQTSRVFAKTDGMIRTDLRPSTNVGTLVASKRLLFERGMLILMTRITPIRVKHHILLEVTYMSSTLAKEQTMIIRIPMMISTVRFCTIILSYYHSLITSVLSAA